MIYGAKDAPFIESKERASDKRYCNIKKRKMQEGGNL